MTHQSGFFETDDGQPFHVHGHNMSDETMQAIEQLVKHVVKLMDDGWEPQGDRITQNDAPESDYDTGDYPDSDDDYEMDWFDEALSDCSMMADGQCGQAGSEYCDFECPIMTMWERGDFDEDVGQ